MRELRQTGRMAVAKLLSLVTLGSATLQGSGTHSVGKVIDMLQDMSATAKKSKQEEEVAFSKFSSWCSLEQTTLAKEVQQSNDKIELVGARIEKLKSSAKTLAATVSDLKNKVEKGKADITAEKNQREKDHKAYVAESTDYAQSVDALERAITTLQKQNYDRPALLQLTEAVPAKAKAIISILISGMDGRGNMADLDSASGTAPEANAYEFQSDGIIDLLTKLQDDFNLKLDACQKGEANSKHASDMIIADLAASVKTAERETEEKIVTRERKLEGVALNKKELEATSQINVQNRATLETVTAECREKALSFEEKQNLRVEEIDAIAQAIEILSSPEVSGNAQKHLGLMQIAPATSPMLVQLSGGAWPEGMQMRVREFLSSEGSRLHSQRLILLSQQASADPFMKVKGMIDAMITRLQEQAQADAAHEGFCDTELGKSKITRTTLSEDIDGLSASVESGKALVASLKEDIAILTKEVAALVQSIKDATALRTTEKSTNTATVKDAEAAQAAIQSAVAVLKAFYEKAGSATALLQAHVSQGQNAQKWGLQKAVKFGSDEWNALAAPGSAQVDTGHKEGMQTFGESYTGQQDEAEYGVLGLLAVVQSDFANLEADTKAAEVESQHAYNEFMSANKKNQAVKERTIEMSNSDKAGAEEKLQKDIMELKTRQDELLAADRYHARLVPQCIDQGMSFKERTQARAAEVESLKQALEMLDGDAAAGAA